MSPSQKVCHLCTYPIGGAATAMYRISRSVNGFVESHTMTRDKCKPFSSDSTMWQRLWRALYYRWNRINPQAQSNAFGVRTFSSALSPLTGRHMDLLNEYDILHLHWISNFINLPAFMRRFGGTKPIVWTLHDMNPLLGGAHYRQDSKQIASTLGNGLELGNARRNDLDNKAYLIKKHAFDALTPNAMHIVCPSKWLTEEAAKSNSLGKFPICTIKNPVDTSIFKPLDRKAARSVFGIDSDCVVLLFIAMSLDDKYKGGQVMLEALKQFPLKKLVLLSVGKAELPVNGAGIDIRSLGFVANERMLSIAYSAADAFILPSLDENLPSTMLESLACGTPVIGSDVGGIPDLVVHGKTGMLFQPGDATELAQRIRTFLDFSDEQRTEMGEICRQSIEEHCGPDKIGKQYAELYGSLLK